MAFDVEAARAEGYSDEDIEKYIASQGQTMTGEAIPATPAVAEQVPMDRSNEYMGLAGAGAVGAGAALAGKALILDPIRQGISNMMSSAPTAGPVAPSPAPVASAPAQQSMRALGPLARGAAKVAGPAGLALGVYDAGQMARETELGSRLQQGQGQQAEQAFRKLSAQYGNAMSPQEAQNVLASGSQRDIAAFGGADKLRELMRQKAAQRVLGQQQ
jgi:hypothetical protein